MDELTVHQITPVVVKSLGIVARFPGLSPRWFAKQMWPNSPSWTRHTNCGHGSCKGVGVTKKGGSLLNRLREMGLITTQNKLTRLGLNILEGY